MSFTFAQPVALRPGHDTVVRRALLGLQCRDLVDHRVVAEGLRVELVDLWRPERRRDLVANRSGVFVLHDFPGLNSFGDVPAGASPADSSTTASSPGDEAGRWRLTVRDTLARYLPLTLAPTLPAEGLLGLAGGAVSPAGPHSDTDPWLPLYSAPTRPLPVAQASLRTELRRASAPDQPVPWARLELWLGSEVIGEGMSDANGRALLVFALPRPREATLRTSPAGSATRFDWPVTLRAFSQPGIGLGLGSGAAPDLESLLAQPEATLLDRPDAPPVPLGPLTLRAGETLVVTGTTSSFLYVAD
jgi:hypothetical protein